MLGKGAFGDVVLAARKAHKEDENFTLVAAKTIHFNASKEANFITNREVYLLKLLQNPHIVKFLGMH